MPLDVPPSPLFSIELPFLQINLGISLSVYYLFSFIFSLYAPSPYFLFCLPHLASALSPRIPPPSASLRPFFCFPEELDIDVNTHRALSAS